MQKKNQEIANQIKTKMAQLKDVKNEYKKARKHYINEEGLIDCDKHTIVVTVSDCDMASDRAVKKYTSLWFLLECNKIYIHLKNNLQTPRNIQMSIDAIKTIRNKLQSPIYFEYDINDRLKNKKYLKKVEKIALGIGFRASTATDATFESWCVTFIL